MLLLEIQGKNPFAPFASWRERGLELTFRVAGLDEIKRWILSFGPEAVVLEPARLREIVRKDLSRNLVQYSKPSVSINLMKDLRAI